MISTWVLEIPNLYTDVAHLNCVPTPNYKYLITEASRNNHETSKTIIPNIWKIVRYSIE